jgi:bifunctional ADP-heptose synthase (sugar kinase/adenylyltransferase)
MNLLALGVAKVYAVGVLGNDPFGRELRRLLETSQVDCNGLIGQDEGWATPTYIKPCVAHQELSRLDFGNFNQLSALAEQEVFAKLDEILPQVSVVLINHQVTGSFHDSQSFRQRLEQLMARNPRLTFIVDSRGYHESYPAAVHKLNEREVMNAAGKPVDPNDAVLLDDLVLQSQNLCGRWQSPLVVTRGERGCLAFSGGECRQIFGLQLAGPTDPVGAGDTFSAALAATISVGAPLSAAAYIANIAAAVTAQKVLQTGTASRDEILELSSRADCVFFPELAESPRRARYVEGAEIEIITGPWSRLNIRHAVFDHDGTISTLREGWEKIMEPMMIRTVLGKFTTTADEALSSRVRLRVRELIARTTGVQTITQMHELVRLIKEFGLVPDAEILPVATYKGI